MFSIDGAKMLTGKDNTNLLDDLLLAHLAPASLQSIKRARKAFKDVRGSVYPVSEEELAKRVPAEEPPPPPAPIVLPTEISADPEPEPATVATMESPPSAEQSQTT